MYPKDKQEYDRDIARGRDLLGEERFRAAWSAGQAMTLDQAVDYALWHDGDFYITSSPAARKARNLAANPACTLSVRLETIDLVFEGEAYRTIQ